MLEWREEQLGTEINHAPLQSVQRAEFWAQFWLCKPFGWDILVLKALQLFGPLASWMTSGLSLVKDGDLVRVTKVEGHATDEDVEEGQARAGDMYGKTPSDAAAKLGRRHQSEFAMNARRVLVNTRSYSYLIFCSFIGLWLLFQGYLLNMTGVVVMLLILWFAIVVVWPSVAAWYQGHC